MENADVFLGLHDFLERMRQPSAADFVKSIKRYFSHSHSIPSISYNPNQSSIQLFFVLLLLIAKILCFLIILELFGYRTWTRAIYS